MLPGYAVMMIVLCTAITLADGKTLVPPATDIGLAALHGGVFIVVGTLLFNLGRPPHPGRGDVGVRPDGDAVRADLGLPRARPKPTTTSLIGGLLIFGAVIGKALYDARPAHRY